nr:reverse transcriptase domain-containing protein [Tanacetum cinerariifolium]
MSTHSSAKNLFSPLDNPKLTIRRRSRSDLTLLNNSEMAAEGNGDLPVPDLRTIEELCQPSMNGRGGPIARIAIQATNFGLKNDMIQQVHNSCQFHGLPGDDANKHLDKFLHVTQSIKANDAILKNMQTNMTSLTNSNLELRNMFGPFIKINTALSSGSETLPGNTITNPTEDLKGITTRRGTVYPGPTIPTTSSSLVVERETEATKDTVNPTNNESTEDLVPRGITKDLQFLIHPDCKIRSSVTKLTTNNKLSLPDFSPTCMTLKLTDRLISRPVGVAEDVFIKVGTFHFPADFVVVDFDVDPRVPLILGRSFLKTRRALIDVFEGELTLRAGKEAITFNLDQTSRYSANYNDMTANGIDVIDMACEEYSQEVLGFSDMIASGNPTPYYDPIVSTTSLTLTPFENSDFLLEEVDAFLAIEDDPTSLEVDQSYVDAEGDILLLEAFLNDDLSLPPPNQGNYLPEVRKELKICEAKSEESLIDKPLEVELKDLPPHLEYAFLEGEDKLPVIIAEDLSVEEKTALITVLKSQKRAIAWKLSDIKGLDPEFFTHKILMEEDFEPAIRRKPHSPAHTEHLLTVAWLLGYAMHQARFREKMLKRCEDTNLCLNWEKSHLMVKEGIVLGHKISKEGIEVDKAKVDVITKLPHLTTVKGIRSFLGHADFYRRFIKDISKIARLMTRLLEKDTPFIFSKECVETFQTLKRKLIEAPILIAPDWDMPFELMCDASDFAIGAVLGQRQDKHFRPIHYVSKTMTEAKSNYTTMGKEMLGMVYAFEKFWSYLIMNKSIVYTDHFALKYLFAKKDSKARLLPGSESRPPMRNKENYVPWSSHLLRYAKSRPNGKLIDNSILNGPYVRRMIPKPGDANRDVNVTET